MWEAQYELWIQNDIVDAIANANSAVAIQRQEDESVPEKDKRLSVLNAPVKHLLETKIHGYVAQDQGTRRTTAARTTGGASAATSLSRLGRSGGGRVQFYNKSAFTNRRCNDTYDVVAFSFSVICDSRKIGLLLREMAKVALVTQTSINIVAVPPPRAYTSYVYGEDPIVQLDLDYEAYFFRDAFYRYMPENLRVQLGATGG